MVPPKTTCGDGRTPGAPLREHSPVALVSPRAGPITLADRVSWQAAVSVSLVTLAV